VLLRAQVLQMQVVLANGTVLDITEKQNPHLWRALQVSYNEKVKDILSKTLHVFPPNDLAQH
jgi:hypothetical protein